MAFIPSNCAVAFSGDLKQMRQSFGIRDLCFFQSFNIDGYVAMGFAVHETLGLRLAVSFSEASRVSDRRAPLI